MAVEVILLDFWYSMFGMRVRIALDVKEIKYKRIEEQMFNKSQLLLEMNPVHQKIPVLIHNGKPVCESLNVVEYIDEYWNKTIPLLPSDPYQRAQARFWADFVDKKVYHFGTKIWKGEDREASTKGFLESLKLLEEELANKPYFGDGKFGFLDIAIITFYSWFYTYEKFGNFSVENECPKLTKWAKRCISRDSVSKNLADQRRVYEGVVEFLKVVN